MEPSRLVLVTGASRGIGRAACLALGRQGAHVIAVARSTKALEALDDEIRSLGANCTLVPLDLKDGAAIDQLGGAIHARWGRLDALIGNAGLLGTIGPLQTVTPKSFEDTIAVNLTANWRLIRALDPLLRQGHDPRAVFVTSGAAPRPRAFWGPYAASKAALEAMIACWADENDKSALRINLFDPGPTRTAMRASAMPGEDPATLPTPDDVAQALIAMAMPQETRHDTRWRYPAG